MKGESTMKRQIKKIAALLLIAVMTATMLLSCSSEKSDWKQIEEKGFFTCGITLFEPMNYIGEDGELTGFETEFAQMVAKKLGVEAKFQIISWGNKYIELNSGAIDCIWNGFTANCKDSDGQERSSKVDFSVAYLDNAQCVVVKSDAVDSYKTAADLAGKTCAVEANSAGETYAASVTDADKIIKKTAQKDTFLELASGNVDFIVVDVILANAIVGQGDYANLSKAAIEIAKEEYAVGCRLGSDFTAKLTDAIKALAESGELGALAEKYGLTLTADLAALKK